MEQRAAAPLYRTEAVFTTSRPGSCASAASEVGTSSYLQQQAAVLVRRRYCTLTTAARPSNVQAGAVGTATTVHTFAAASAAARLRHPGPQHEVQAPRAPHQDSERVVSLLLKELAAARKQEAATAAALAQMQGQLSAATQRGDGERRREFGSGGSRGAAPAAAARPPAAAGGAAGSRTIPAFRPAGQAPPPPVRHGKARAQAVRLDAQAAAPTGVQTSQSEAQALRQDNAELQLQLEALYAHCRNLQRQLGAAGSPAKSPSSGGAATSGSPAAQAAVGVQVRLAQPDSRRQPARAASPQRAQRAQRTDEQEGSTVLAAVLCSSPRRARSPTRVSAAVVRSPAAGGVDELAMAVFEASGTFHCARRG